MAMRRVSARLLSRPKHGRRSSTSVGSKLSGGVVSMEAGRDIAIEGSHISGTQGVAISAGRDLTIVEGRNTTSASTELQSNKTGIGGLAGLLTGTPTIPSLPYGKASTAGIDLQTDTASASTISSSQGGVLLQGGNTVFLQGVQVDAAKDINIKGGNVIIQAATNSTSATSSGSSRTKGIEPGQILWHDPSTGINARRTTETQVEDSTLTRTTLNGANVSIEAADTLAMAATTVNTPGTLSLSADNLILGTQTTQHSEQTTSQGRDLAYQKNRDKGQSDQTTNYNQFNVGTLAVNANHVQAGLGARDSIDALAKQPGMGWVEQITSDPKLNGKINWQRVEEEHKKWDYDQQGLTPEGAAIVTIVVAYFTAGAASEIGAAAGGAAGDAAALAAGQGAVIEGAVFAGGSSIGAGVGTFVSGAVTAGLTTLATQASIALINNQGDIGGALHDLGSSANVHSLLTAVITGGVLAGLNMNPVGLPTSGAGGQQLMTQLQQNLTAGAARAVIGTAINGGSFEDNLREGLKGAILDTIAAQSANWIGQNGPQGDASLNAFTAEVAHAIAGCAVGAARGGGTAGDGCAAGALGAVVGHLSAQFIDPNAVGGNQTVQFANMMSGIAAAITGQDANSINIAAGAGANAAANNWLQPKEAELRRQAAQACGSNPAANAKACGIVEALNQLDAAREAGNNGTLYKGVTSGLIALLMSPVTVPVELINSISENGGSETAIAILKGVALLPTNIALGLQSDNPEVQGRALVDALATTAGVTALTRAGFTIGRGTGTVWDSIKATQDVWPGTSVPRSFELQAGGGGVWVAGNGTKHIAEYAAQLSNAGASPLTIGMATQAELLSLKAAVETVISNGGITYGGRAIVVGGWELRFAPPRPGAKLPALIHALPTNAL